jgi:hypothetical protein
VIPVALRKKLRSARTWAAIVIAGAVVLVDSASHFMSMCADFVLVVILLAVLLPQQGQPDNAQR